MRLKEAVAVVRHSLVHYLSSLHLKDLLLHNNSKHRTCHHYRHSSSSSHRRLSNTVHPAIL